MAPWLLGARKRAERIIGEERAKAPAGDNPGAVLEDKEIPYLLEAENPSKKERRIPIRIPFSKRKNQ